MPRVPVKHSSYKRQIVERLGGFGMKGHVTTPCVSTSNNNGNHVVPAAKSSSWPIPTSSALALPADNTSGVEIDSECHCDCDTSDFNIHDSTPRLKHSH